MKKVLPIVNLLAFIMTLVVNYLSTTGYFSGVTVGEVSHRFDTLITPAPYAFGIWAVIYLCLGAFVISHLSMSNQSVVEVDRVGGWFLVSCLANCSWILAWVHGHIGISVAVIFLLLYSLIRIIVRTDMELPEVGGKTIVFLWWPFSIYLGWICIAAVVNVAAWLVAMGWNGFGMNALVWTIVMILVAGFIYLWLTWKRNMREAALAGVWALVAVGVANRGHAVTVAIIAWAVAGILFLSAVVHAIRSAAKRR